MVGGSATPVVSIAVPTIFALVMAAVGVYGNSSVSKRLSEIESAIEGGRSTAENQTEPLFAEIRAVPGHIGKLLVAFAVLYLLGTLVGTEARVNRWFAPGTEPKELPWSGSEMPPSVSHCLDWIILQEKLLDWGYTESDVAECYRIQLNDWDRNQSDQSGYSYFKSVAEQIPWPVEVYGADVQERKPRKMLPGLFWDTSPFPNSE
jgi:hypothetical protein